MSGTAKHYISLFTGAGGLDIGFNEAGFMVCWHLT